MAGALGIVIAHLARDAGLQQRLREEPVLIDHAVNEILRSDGPLVSNNRTATRDVEIGGRSIATGERLSLRGIAANRDPSAFEDPASVDLRRPAEQSVLFGTGIHRCLGELLARLEPRTAVAELLRNLDGIEATSNEISPRHVYRATASPSCRSASGPEPPSDRRPPARIAGTSKLPHLSGTAAPEGAVRRWPAASIGHGGAGRGSPALACRIYRARRRRKGRPASGYVTYRAPGRTTVVRRPDAASIGQGDA